MLMQTRSLLALITLAILIFSGGASADPPSRIGRLGYVNGPVSFSPAGEDDWLQATINRPLTSGDRLWADADARAEIQVGGAMIRINGGTGVSILNIDGQITQLQLSQGTMNVRVRHLDSDEVFEVDTPNLAYVLRERGEYRIEVDPNDNSTTIFMRNGQGEAYGEGNAYAIDSGQPYRFTGTDLGEYQYVDAPQFDDFDRWSSDRDHSYDNSGSARYVSQDIVGYQDLDTNGSWRADASYGNVWTPNRVPVGWAPYRDGHWAWIDPWGWTWVDDAPWGFAVSHYGRWMNSRGTWCWVPGPVHTRAYYAPALVVFVGGNNFNVGNNVSGVAWFPLGPREVYRPSYTVSRRYFEDVNRSNTVINTTVINNYYNNTNVTNVVYANRKVRGAVVAVPTTAFARSQPVSAAAVQVSQNVIASGPVEFVPPVVPTQTSVRGAAARSDNPPSKIFERRVVARTAPPDARVGFAAQQQELTATPGKPLDDSARKQLKVATNAPVPPAPVTVVAQAQQAPPTSHPPAVARGDHKNSNPRDKSNEPAAPVPPVAAAAAPSQAAPPVAATQPPMQRDAGQVQAAQPPEQHRKPPFAQTDKPQQAGKGDAPWQPTPAPPHNPTQPDNSAPPQAAPPVAAAQAPEHHRPSADTRQQTGKGAKPATPTKPQTPTEPETRASAQAAPPVTAVQPPDQHRPPIAQSEANQQTGKGAKPSQPHRETVPEPAAAPPLASPKAPVQTTAQQAKPDHGHSARQTDSNAAVAAAAAPPAAPNRDAQSPGPATEKELSAKQKREAEKKRQEAARALTEQPATP
jgi:hypothetical protein